MDINSWWEMLTGIQQVYWAIAIPASTILLGMLALTFIGGDGVDDLGQVDADVDADHGIGFQFFTLKNMVGFFTIFGWSGLACIDSGLGTGMTLVISSICGLLMMTAMAALFYFISKLSESGTLELKNAIGKTGEVYLPVLKKRDGFGKIQVSVQGSLRTLQALTDDEVDLRVGEIVYVRGLVNDNILLVSKEIA